MVGSGDRSKCTRETIMQVVRLLSGVTVLSSLLACSNMQLGGEGSSLLGGVRSGGGAATTTTTTTTADSSPQLKHCPAPIGTIALVESNYPALAQAGLTSPVSLIRLMSAQS